MGHNREEEVRQSTVSHPPTFGASLHSTSLGSCLIMHVASSSTLVTMLGGFKHSSALRMHLVEGVSGQWLCAHMLSCCPQEILDLLQDGPEASAPPENEQV